MSVTRRLAYEAGSAAHLMTTFARAGLLRPGRPDRVAGQVAALVRWGLSLAGEYAAAARRDPDAIAIVDDAGALTYGEVDARTNRLARALTADRPGVPRIGLLCRNHRGLVEVLVAAAKLGADVVLLNTGLSTVQLTAVVAEQRLDLLVADADLAVPAGVPRVYGWTDTPVQGRTLDDLIASGDPAPLDPPDRPGRTVVLTSGTTGTPKGARRPAPGGLTPVAAMLSKIPLRVGDRVLIAAPLFHTWGYGGLQLATAVRASIVLTRRFEPTAVLDRLAAQRCTALWVVPVMLQRLLEVPTVPQPDLRIVASSGSALPGDLALEFMARYGDVLYNLYGSTEASWVSVAQPADLRAAPGTAGRPPRGTRLAILDDAARPVPTGQPGHIFVGNEMLFEGYTDGNANEIRDGLLRIGDVGHLDDAGRLFVDGRGDDMIISGGENVFPREVEDLLVRHPQIRDCCVVGVPDDDYGQRLTAYVVPAPGATLDADAVRDHVRAHLARFAVPRDVWLVPELPRNATGKVVFRDLPHG